MFSSAGPAEIVRSNQKDEYYLNYLRSNAADIFQSIVGARSWIKWRQELDVCANALYFILTTVSGYQTLGEEYCNIVQVDESKRAVPSRLRRCAFVLLQCFFPYILDKALLQLEQNPELISDPDSLPLSQDRIQKSIPLLRQALTLLHRTHLATFYLWGGFYHIAKRFTGIHYLLVRNGLIGGSDSRPTYKLLGWLSIAQLAVAAINYIILLLKKKNTAKQEGQQSLATGRSQSSARGDSYSKARCCSLCLDVRQDSTAGPCGHMFCWNCITEWCATKPECPICRQKMQLSRLIPLQQYD